MSILHGMFSENTMQSFTLKSGYTGYMLSHNSWIPLWNVVDSFKHCLRNAQKCSMRFKSGGCACRWRSWNGRDANHSCTILLMSLDQYPTERPTCLDPGNVGNKCTINLTTLSSTRCVEMSMLEEWRQTKTSIVTLISWQWEPKSSLCPTSSILFETVTYTNWVFNVLLWHSRHHQKIGIFYSPKWILKSHDTWEREREISHMSVPLIHLT